MLSFSQWEKGRRCAPAPANAQKPESIAGHIRFQGSTRCQTRSAAAGRRRRRNLSAALYFAPGAASSSRHRGQLPGLLDAEQRLEKIVQAGRDAEEEPKRGQIRVHTGSAKRALNKMETVEPQILRPSLSPEAGR
jgi:hypothetical protein